MKKLPGQLKFLNEEQHQYLISLLSLGKTDGEITDAIQIEKGWLTNVTRTTLLRCVNRWRKGSGQTAVIKQVADLMISQNGKPKHQIDVIEELGTLIEKQKKRLAKISKMEDANDSLLLQTVTDEIKTLVVMLERLGRFQLDIGIMRKVRVGEKLEDYRMADDEAETPVDLYSEEHRRLLKIVEEEMGIGVTIER